MLWFRYDTVDGKLRPVRTIFETIACIFAFWGQEFRAPDVKVRPSSTPNIGFGMIDTIST
jgi:hypothetical protein